VKTRRARIGLCLLALGALAVFEAGSAVADVAVTLQVAGGTRVMAVRELDDSANLTAITFGQSNAYPFLVKVEDDALAPTAYSIAAEMTKLYKSSGGLWTTGAIIGSNKLSISAVTPLAVTDVAAQVQPLVDLAASSLPAPVCVVVTAALGSCAISLTGLTGTVRTITGFDVNSLNLPLVPSAPEAGAFSYPTYTADSPDTPGAPHAATSRVLLSGSSNVADATLLTTVKTLTQTAVNGLTVTQVVDQEDLITAIQGLVPLLSDAQALSIVTGSTWTKTVQNILTSQILSLTGKYRSYPILNVDPSGAPEATYKGTLVVTGIS
jgi:hypothetical protein